MLTTSLIISPCRLKSKIIFDQSQDKGPTPTPKVCWSKLTPETVQLYSNSVVAGLPNLPSHFLSCRNPHCSLHSDLLDSLSVQLLDCLQRASDRCLPHVKPRSSNVPGWNVCALNRYQLDFGIACGVNVVVYLLVCCPKSNETLRLDVSMRFVGLEDVSNISDERKWAQLFLRPDREIFGKKFVR